MQAAGLGLDHPCGPANGSVAWALRPGAFLVNHHVRRGTSASNSTTCEESSLPNPPPDPNRLGRLSRILHDPGGCCRIAEVWLLQSLHRAQSERGGRAMFRQLVHTMQKKTTNGPVGSVSSSSVCFFPPTAGTLCFSPAHHESSRSRHGSHDPGRIVTNRGEKRLDVAFVISLLPAIFLPYVGAMKRRSSNHEGVDYPNRRDSQC